MSLEFDILDEEKILKNSVIEVKTGELLERNKTRKPGGFLDAYFGAITFGEICPICNKNNYDCIGHFGHFKLATPVFNPGFFATTKKILETICFYCANIKIEFSEKDSFTEIWKTCKTKRNCFHCSLKNLPEFKKGEGITISVKNNTTIIEEDPEEQDQVSFSIKDRLKKQKVIRGTVNTFYILDLFSRIPENARKIFKIKNPKNLLMTIMPVPPICIRPPTVEIDESSGEATFISNDDLTIKLVDIFKSNSTLNNSFLEDTSDRIIIQLISILQSHISAYVQGDSSAATSTANASSNRLGRPIKSIFSRLKGKEGRIRLNLMGKRVNFCARTVITGDPMLSIDEVGIPKYIAKILTIPVRVNDRNINNIRTLVKNTFGGNIYPHAITIRKKTNNFKLVYLKPTLTDEDKELLMPETGDIIERQLIDGDPVIFNRQPSLHKMSMMCHKVRVMQYKTFRMNLSVTAPYNADFDKGACCPF